MSTDRRITLYDTTLRDGTQGAGITLSADDKLRIAEKLDEFGIDYIEGGWPGSNPKDMEFFERARARTWRHARHAGGGRVRKVLGPARARGLAHDPGREPGDDRGLCAVPEVPGHRGDLRRRALLRRVEGEPGVRARDPPGRPEGRRRRARPVRHQWGEPPRRHPRGGGGRAPGR